MILCLFGAQPTRTSLQIGGCLLVSSLVILFWIRGYQFPRDRIMWVGPYRFVRFPRRLALWLIALAASFASLSFPAMIWALGMLPWFLERDEAGSPQESHVKSHKHYERFVPKLLPTLIPYQAVRNETNIAQFRWMKALFAPSFLRKWSLFGILFLSLSLSLPFFFPMQRWYFPSLLGLWILIRLLNRLADKRHRG